MKFLDLFAGIGGFRLGMEKAGHECVGYVEWDKYARKSYEAIYDTKGEWTAHDITTVTDNDIRLLGGKGIDLICGGFPCQAFSVAGRRGGFEDTRGTLFFEIARIAKKIKPRFLLLENVKGLLSHDKGRTFGTILNTLDELGYDCEWQVLNSKNFGVPQNRERVFIVGHLRGSGGPEVFPIGRTDAATDLPVEIIAHRKNYRRNMQTFHPDGITEALDTGQGGGRGHYTVISMGNVNPSGRGMNGQVYDSNGLPPTLTTNKGEGVKVVVPVLTPDRAEKRQNGRRFKEDGDPMFTLTAQDKHGVLITQLDEITKKSRPNQEIQYTFQENGDIRPHRMDAKKSGISELNINYEDNPSHTVTTTHAPKVYGESTGYCIRKLTPRECWRLQGFPDWAFDKAQAVNSDSQLYKQAGNSVTVNVVHEIAKRLTKEKGHTK